MDAVKNFAISTVAVAPSASPPAITIIDVQNQATAVGASLVFPPFEANPANGDTIVVTVGAAASNTSLPTDNKGNTYVKLGESSNSGLRDAIYYAKNIVGGSNFIVSSPAIGPGTENGGVAWCLRNVDPDPYNLDFYMTGIGGAGSATAGPSAVLPARPGSIYIAGLLYRQLGSSLVDATNWNNIANGFTSGMLARTRILFDSGTTYSHASEYRIGSVPLTASWTSAGQAWASAIASFKPSPYGLTLATGDGAKFPNPPYNVTVWPAGVKPTSSNAEIIRVMEKSGDILHGLLRAQEGSTQRTIVVGDQIAIAVTAKTLTDLQALAPGLKFLEERIANDSASLDVTTAFTSAYDEYLIELVNVIPVTSGANLLWRVSTDGGATYDASSNYYTGMMTVSNAAGPAGVAQNAQTAGQIFGNCSSTVTEGGISGALRVFNPRGITSRTNMTISISAAAVGAASYGSGMCLWNLTTLVNAMRFLFSSGNIASGVIRVYGFAKA